MPAAPCLILLMGLLAIPGPSAAEQRRMTCLSEEETRGALQAKQMVAPVRAVEAALRAAPGESVGIRLCRNDAAMVYDVTVLRHDGRLVHILVDAGTGSAAPAPAGR